MAKSRNRPGHKYQPPADIPAKQRTKGRIVWAILFAVFGSTVAFFASDQNYIALVAGALVGAGLGYPVGKTMEKEASGK